VRIPQANDFATRQATIFDYADGRTQIAHIGVNRVSVPLDRIPQVVRSAVLAAEDRSFYTESAVSPTGILRALRNDLTSGSGALQGGSTITQQYVKNYYLTEQQTVSRKLDEALVAIKIDQQMSKDTILQNYLNTIYFARGAYGIEAAARAYFGVDVWMLASDPAKAAYLAALVQSPYYFSTADHDPAAAQALSQRWAYVLDGMVTEHWLSGQVRRTLTFPATIAENTNQLAGANGYLVNAATAYLDQAHQQDPSVPDSTVIARGGYTVVTTFQQNLLTAANDVVTQDLASLRPQANPADANVHVGLAALDTTTGAVLGFYGGADYVKRGYNDATQAAGPTGSTVGTELASGVDADPKANWPAAIGDLGQLGVKDANPRDVPPSDDDLSATPLVAAAAYQAVLDHGIVHQPFEVSEVLYDGNVVWRATPNAQGFPNSGPAQHGLLTSGVDGSLQWAWSVGGLGHVAIAVDMYATRPNGVTNRVLTGMSSPYPGAREPGEPVAQQRTTGIWTGYFKDVVRQQPALLAGGSSPQLELQLAQKSALDAVPPADAPTADVPAEEVPADKQRQAAVPARKQRQAVVPTG
jgi:membrane peptidoglycan carboxypeptidase